MPGKSSPPSPQGGSKHLRLLGPSLAQVKHLSGVEIPQEGLDDLSALQGTGGVSQGLRGPQWRAAPEKDRRCRNQAQQGRRVETGSYFLRISGSEGWGGSCNGTWEELLGMGAGVRRGW